MGGAIGEKAPVNILPIQFQLKLENGLSRIISLQILPALADGCVHAGGLAGGYGRKGLAGVGVAFCDFQRRAKEKLEKQAAELTEPASVGGLELAVLKDKAVLEALVSVRFFDKLIKRKGLTRIYEYVLYGFSGKGEIMGLIKLIFCLLYTSDAADD